MGRRTASAPAASESAQPAELAELRAKNERLQRQIDDQTRLNTMLRDSAEQFVGAMAHDLKNPLAAIKINVQGLKRWLDKGAAPDPALWAERLERIDISVQQLLEHIAAARSRINVNSSHRADLHKEPVDAVALVRQIVETYRQAARHHQLRFECKWPVLVGFWDGERLRAALEAIVDNALKFSPSGGSVWVRLERDQTEGQDCAVLEVRDNGIGIPPRDLPHVFERFYRAENVVGSFKGPGLGLFEARLDIQQHAGSISVKSTEGKGSVFTVRLPVRA